MERGNPLHGMNGSQYISLAVILRASDSVIVSQYSRDREVTIEGVRECVAGNPNIQVDKRYIVSGHAQSIHYTMDISGRVYSVVTTEKFPARVAFQAIEELRQHFSAEFGDLVAQAKELSLSSSSHYLLKKVCDKYSKMATNDSMVVIQDKIDVVKSTMKDSIEQLLINSEQLEKIEHSTIHLNEQSIAFRTSTKALANKMFWQKWKMRLAICGIVMLIIGVIIIPIVATLPSK